MPANAARLVPFREFLKLKTFPKKPPLLFMTRGERTRFLAGARRMKIEDLRQHLVPGSIVVQFTPFPDGNIVQMRCWSKNPEEFCIPTFGGGPGHVQVTKCTCINTGPIDNTPGKAPGGIRPTPCAPVFTSTGMTCAGSCGTLLRHMRCVLSYARAEDGSYLVSCVCRLPSGTWRPGRRPS